MSIPGRKRVMLLIYGRSWFGNGSLPSVYLNLLFIGESALLIALSVGSILLSIWLNSRAPVMPAGADSRASRVIDTVAVGTVEQAVQRDDLLVLR